MHQVVGAFWPPPTPESKLLSERLNLSAVTHFIAIHVNARADLQVTTIVPFPDWVARDGTDDVYSGGAIELRKSGPDLTGAFH